MRARILISIRQRAPNHVTVFDYDLSMRPDNSGNPLGDVIRPTNRRRGEPGDNRRVVVLGIVGIVALGVYAVLAAAFNSTGSIQRASDVVDVPSCNVGTEISVGHSVDASGNTRVSTVQVSGINARCDGAPVALVFVDQSGAVLDEIVWVLDLRPGDQSITAAANGSITSANNTSTSGASLNYPASQTNPEGLSANLMSSDVFGVTFIDIPNERAARF